ITAVRFSLNEENRYVEYRPGVPNDEDRQDKPGAGGDQQVDIGADETTADETTGVPMIVNRLKKNRRLLKKFLAREGVSCYRIYDADIPQYSAAIDIYEDAYAVIQEYAPPKTVDQDRAARRLQEIVAAVPLCFPIEPNHIYLKQRKRQKGDRQYGKLGQEGEFYIVREGGLKFFVNFSDYLDTGIFLDHRPTRDLIRRRAEGARVLNLFAYTCTASVYAADGGAARTVSVDTSATYLDWGRKNFGLNRIPVEPHLFQRQDSLEFLRTDVDRYDLIFIDPPTFSNRKGAPDVFDVQRDHGMMIDLAVQRLAPGGLIVFSNNFRRFAMDPGLEERLLVEEISRDTIPADFGRNPKIHRTWLIRKRD
ncbi:MAG: class I SAM-dependent methyltransferase, partial [Sediminispirochaetaceae bacterium]